MKKYPILCSLVLLLSAASCSSEFDWSVQDVDLLEVASRMVTFSTEESSRRVDVKSDVEWNVSKDGAADWLTVEQQTEGIMIKVSENVTILSRETVLHVEAGDRKTEIKVRQDGVVPSFTSSMDMMAFVYGGGSEVVEVTSNVDWEAKTYCDWMVLAETESGLSITAMENATERRRTANVDFYNSGRRFASILVTQASSYPQPANYYSVDMSTVDWDVSSVHYVKDSKGLLVAVLTKENIDGNIGAFIYPAPSGVEDYSVRTAVTADTMFIRTDDFRVYDYDPHSIFEEVEKAHHTPLSVTTDVKTHGAVKIGDQIWLSEDYKTTRYVDGTQIPYYEDGDKFWTAGDAVVACHNGHYNYTGYTIGWDGSKCDYSNFAPEGWAVPTKDHYLTLVTATGKNLDNLMNNYLFNATINYKFTASSGKVKASQLKYTNTWTCTPSKPKLYMLGLNPDNTTTNSAQAVTGCFAVRLIKE